MIIVNSVGIEVLAADLARAEALAPGATRTVVVANARELQQSWRRRWSGIKPSSLAASVTFSVTRGVGSVKAEIGPDKQIGGGPLGNLIEFEFGSPKSAPTPGGLPSAQEQEPKFERSLAAMAAGLLA